jgi:hypothetical protein
MVGGEYKRFMRTFSALTKLTVDRRKEIKKENRPKRLVWRTRRLGVDKRVAIPFSSLKTG